MSRIRLTRRRRMTKAASKDVLDVFEAAWLIGAHIETLRRLARRDDVPAYKVGKDWRFSRKALEHWRETHHFGRRQPLALVADDDEDIRAMMGLFLKQDGYRVALAATGRDALDAAKHDMPDVVLLDLMMPGMSGVDVLKNLHAMNPDTPVIIVTGYPDSKLVAEAMRCPPVTLLAKPVDRQALIRSVHRVIHGARGAPRVLPSAARIRKEKLGG